jgi:hypothetical protein
MYTYQASKALKAYAEHTDVLHQRPVIALLLKMKKILGV